MISTIVATLSLAGALTLGAVAVQTPPAVGSSDVLGTVHIPRAVLAGGKPLPIGSYELRLTNDRPAALVGQSPDAERWVELASNGSVVAREVAVVLRDADRPAIGASSVVAASGTRVDLLKDGDFLRISVKRGTERYLVYLPVVR